ncbi:MAG: HAMP domain-containing protein [Candidatus Promineofilum sp.]|nr:HAMP domain-containing protein [Promineifilum sp.]
MLPKVFWRIAIPFLTVTLAAMGAALLLSRSGCAADADCVLNTILVIAGLSVGAVLLLSWAIAERTTRPLRNMTEVAKRIAAGDDSARVLTQRRDETGDLIRAFGEMTEHQRDRIGSLSQDYRRFATVLDHMADGVLITDHMGHVLFVNPAARRLLATTERDALGRSFAAVVRHHALIELWQRGRDERTEQVEAVEISPDLFLQAVVTPYQGDEASGYVIIIQDLTQVRRLQVMRRDFISNLSHELRSPLASLRAVVETLEDGAINDPPAAERFLRQAENEVNTMTQMVEELTELSQIESGQIRLRLAPTTVVDLIDGPVERLRPQAEANGLALAVDLPPDLPRVLVDGERVRQVVANLLHNAIKFTPSGGRVLVTAAPAEGKGKSAAAEEVVIEVRDTGVGIAKGDLPRVFERFYKSDRARTRGRGGTGLGLAIARHIVETHGGRIWVKSKEGQGSSFFFSLPATGGYEDRLQV